MVTYTYYKQSTASHGHGKSRGGLPACPPSLATPNRPAHLQQPCTSLSIAMTVRVPISARRWNLTSRTYSTLTLTHPPCAQPTCRHLLPNGGRAKPTCPGNSEDISPLALYTQPSISFVCSADAMHSNVTHDLTAQCFERPLLPVSVGA